MTAQFDIISPGSGQKYTSVPLLSESEALSKLQAADTAFKTWKQTTLQDRVAVLTKFVDALCADKDEIALELSHLMGRYIHHKLQNKSTQSPEQAVEAKLQ